MLSWGQVVSPPTGTCPFPPSCPGHLTSPSGSGQREISAASAPRLGLRPLAEADSLAFSHQLERKAKLTKAVKTLGLPGAKARVKPGQVCSVAGWGQVARGIQTSTLQEAKLRVQDDVACEFPFPSGYYHRASQICVGNPRDMKTSFKVRFPALGRGTQGGLGRGEAMLSCLSLSARAPDL